MCAHHLRSRPLYRYADLVSAYALVRPAQFGRELVEGAGVPRSVIAKLEAGGTARLATIRKLAAFLKVEPEELMSQPPAD